MTVLDFLKSKSAEEIAENYEIVSALDYDVFDCASDCYECDCEYLGHSTCCEDQIYEGQCETWRNNGICPHNIDREEVRKRLVIEWLNKEM